MTRPVTARIALAAFVVTAAGATSAVAALPKQGRDYRGKTSQGQRLTIEMKAKRRTIDSIAADVISHCAKLGPSRQYTLDVELAVRRDGSFRGTSYGVDEGDWSSEPVTIGGQQRAVVEVSKTQIVGKFLTSRHAQGTWRHETVLYDRVAYPADQQPVDRCDTGIVTWQARLKRR